MSRRGLNAVATGQRDAEMLHDVDIVAMDAPPVVLESAGPEADSGSDDTYYGAILKKTTFQSLSELVAEKGGSLNQVLGNFDDFPVTEDDKLVIFSAKKWVSMLEKASRDLKCPDLGLRLALKDFNSSDENPFLLALRNAETIGEAISWGTRSSRSYVQALHTYCKPPPKSQGVGVVEYNILLDRVARKAQAVEYAMAMIYHRIMEVSGGDISTCEIWFRHEPVSPMPTYLRYFRARVRFGKPIDALLLGHAEWHRPVANRNKGIYELAKFYVESKYPELKNLRLSDDVERVAAQLLVRSSCALSDVAAELGLHTRTLQRRLREEGTSFGDVKERAQRALALKYLANKSISLKNISELLGYSESSAFTRSCYRWFSASPRKVRSMLAIGISPQMDGGRFT